MRGCDSRRGLKIYPRRGDGMVDIRDLKSREALNPRESSSLSPGTILRSNIRDEKGGAMFCTGKTASRGRERLGWRAKSTCDRVSPPAPYHMQPYKTLFIVLAVLAFHALPISSTAHETEGENTAVIHIDENGFSPDVITVAPGTEVIFENTGTEDHWPASDNPPTHTRYDGTTLQEHCANGHSNTFDSCGPISPGDSWSFVFKKGGSFAFHDHLWAHFDRKSTR